MSVRSLAGTAPLLVLCGPLWGCTSKEERFAEALSSMVARHQARLVELRGQLQAVQAAARAHPPLQPIATPWAGPPIDGRQFLP